MWTRLPCADRSLAALVSGGDGIEAAVLDRALVFQPVLGAKQGQDGGPRGAGEIDRHGFEQVKPVS